MKKKLRRLHLRAETLRTLNVEVEQVAAGAIGPGGGSVIGETFLCTNDPTAMTWCYKCPEADS